MKPLQIGPVTVNSPVMLAPMAGVTDRVFRALVREWAPESLICTEMISSNGLVFSPKGKKNLFILEKSPVDHPIAYQLAAHKVDVLVEAAQQIIAEKNPDTLDLNMGCPVKKITGNFEGCALMKTPDVASELIKAVVAVAGDRPVTVKFRLGWDQQSMNYLEFGQMCQEAGAQMVTLHARTRSQGYQPGCKWEAFGELKQALSIPVIANGDINSYEDAAFVMREYGVDGVMIGRGCLGKPWMIGDIDRALKTGEPPVKRPLKERLAVAYRHAAHYAAARGEEMAMREMRKQLAWYATDFAGASAARGILTKVQSLQEVETIFDDILQANQRQQQVAV